MSKLKFSATNDYAFKKLFGTIKNIPVLRRFLSLILGISESDVNGIHLKNPMIGGDYDLGKPGIIDIKAALNDMVINIEMQNLWHDYYEERVIFGLAKSYAEDIEKGEDYGKLKPCISISILNSKFPYSKKIHSIYRMLEAKDHTPFKNLLELHFLDLTKVRGGKEASELEKWLLFIKTEDEKLREELSEGDEIMKKANITMKEFYSNEKERMRYDALFMFECDKATMRRVGLEEGMEKGMEKGMMRGIKKGIRKGRVEGIEEGMKKGIAEGMEKGMEKGRAEGMEEAARNMLKEGTPIEAIIRWTGLSRERIDMIKGGL